MLVLISTYGDYESVALVAVKSADTETILPVIDYSTGTPPLATRLPHRKDRQEGQARSMHSGADAGVLSRFKTHLGVSHR